MSTQSTAAQNLAGTRVRVPRFAEAAVERARLTVVPQRSFGRTQAARTPFAVLVLGLLAAGVVGLLMFNTQMQQASFKASALKSQVTQLTAEQQSLDMELDTLRDPQRLADSAKALGMVPPAQPAFVRLSDGAVLGKAAPASPGDAVRINPLPARKPTELAPKPIVIRVPAKPATTPTTRNGAAAPGAASGDATAPRDRKNQSSDQTSAQADSGATR